MEVDGRSGGSDPHRPWRGGDEPRVSEGRWCRTEGCPVAGRCDTARGRDATTGGEGEDRSGPEMVRVGEVEEDVHGGRSG